MMTKAVAIIFLLIGLLIFSLQNYRPVGINLLFWKLEANMLILTVGLFAAGFVVGLLVGFWKRDR